MDRQSTAPSRGATRLFYSYASSDQAFQRQLEKHLSVLRRAGILETWNFTQIDPGSDWEASIHESLASASVILLLVSADFLNSDYCWNVEMRQALVRHRVGEAIVIPIILRPCDWKSAPFADLQALPDKGKPIVDWRTRDRAWANVVSGIRQVLARPALGQRSARSETAGSTDSWMRKPWHLGSIEEGVPTLFAYKGIGRFDGICVIEQHRLADGRVLFVCSSIPDNPGRSVTNSIEYIALQLSSRFDVLLDDMIVIEHYADDRTAAEWEIVEFRRPDGKESVGTPRWRPVTEDEWQEFGLSPRLRRSVPRSTRRSLLVRRRGAG